MGFGYGWIWMVRYKYCLHVVVFDVLMLGTGEGKEASGEHLVISGVWMCMLERGGAATALSSYLL